MECPDDTYDLHYFMVRFDVEPPDGTTCLDYLRMFVVNFNDIDSMTRCVNQV